MHGVVGRAEGKEREKQGEEGDRCGQKGRVGGERVSGSAFSSGLSSPSCSATHISIYLRCSSPS